MSYTELQIVNKALGRIGGAGDQFGSDPFITAAKWALAATAAADKVSNFAYALYPQCRRKVIEDLADRGSAFRETIKYADLGSDLKQYDRSIDSITVGAGPGYTITVVTNDAHGRSTGDKVYLTGIRGDGDIETLNNTVYTITVVDTTSFTLDSTTGDSAYDHTEDTGQMSLAPETGQWLYAFNLPTDCIGVICQLDEEFLSTEVNRQKYRFEVILNRDADGQLLLTNNFTNYEGDSAFIAYVIEQTDPSLFSNVMVECIVSLLAAELCPIVGRDLKTRQEQMTEYERISLPDAQSHNGRQKDNISRTVTNYRGGRS